MRGTKTGARTVPPTGLHLAQLDTQLSKVQIFMAKPKYSLEIRLNVVNYYFKETMAQNVQPNFLVL